MDPNVIDAPCALSPSELSRIDGGALIRLRFEPIEPPFATLPEPGEPAIAPWPVWICATPLLDF